ncbi:unnamed protein product, partial [Protopolystoma xenopodis]
QHQHQHQHQHPHCGLIAYQPPQQAQFYQHGVLPADGSQLFSSPPPSQTGAFPVTGQKTPATPAHPALFLGPGNTPTSPPGNNDAGAHSAHSAHSASTCLTPPSAALELCPALATVYPASSGAITAWQPADCGLPTNSQTAGHQAYLAMQASALQQFMAFSPASSQRPDNSSPVNNLACNQLHSMNPGDLANATVDPSLQISYPTHHLPNQQLHYHPQHPRAQHTLQHHQLQQQHESGLPPPPFHHPKKHHHHCHQQQQPTCNYSPKHSRKLMQQPLYPQQTHLSQSHSDLLNHQLQPPSTPPPPPSSSSNTYSHVG